MNFDKLTEVAQWLGKDRDAINIQNAKYLFQEGRYYVTVWGHYSAGKSRLINNIIDRDILPVRSRETTAVLTYLQYGEEEECRVFYKDGTILSCEVGKLKEIFQNEESDEELSKVDHLEVYINSEVLENGIILVDTPGVNTVIQKHQDLAVEAIDQSGKIIYVLGNSPSNVDKNFIKQITDCGIEIIFIRTKCDRFSETEEDADASLLKEKETLQQFVGKDITFIPVSNEGDSKWHHNIEAVRRALGQLSANMAAEMEKPVESRLRIYQNAYEGELKSEEVRLENLIRGKDEDIQKEIDEAERNLKQLEGLDSESIKRIEESVKNKKREAKQDLETMISERERKFEALVEETPCSSGAAETIRNQYDKCLLKAVQDMRERLNSYFDSIIDSEQQTVENVSQNLNFETLAPSFSEIQMDNNRILELYRNRLVTYKTELEQIQSDRQVLSANDAKISESFDEEELNAELAELNAALAQIPTDIAMKVSEDQGVRPSDVFRGIGEAADMALLLLPGDAIVTGVKTLAKGTNVVVKTAQGMNKIKRATGLAKNIDSVRDVAYMANCVMKGRKYSSKKDRDTVQGLVDKAALSAGRAYDDFKEKKEKGTALDMLSVAFWTEKLGACFDPPLKMEVDTLQEAEKNRVRREITERQRVLSEERIQKKKQLNLITTKEKELEESEREKSRQRDEIEREMAQKEDSIRREAEKQALDRFKKDYVDYYASSLRQAGDMLMEEYFQMASQNIVMYAAGQNAELRRCIEEKKEQLESLLALRESGTAALQERLTVCQQYIHEMEIS